MKKILLACITLCSLSILSIQPLFAQQENLLQTIYTKIDTIRTTQPTAIPLLIEKIDTLDTQVKDTNTRTLFSQIRQYLIQNLPDAKMIPSWLASHRYYTLPAWYKKIQKEDLAYIQDLFHFSWSSDAPIRVIEFLDFQCPYCQKQHFNKTLEILREHQYPEKVRTASAMFPLSGKRHELAQQAAESAECVFLQEGTEAFMKHQDGLFNAWLQPTMTTIKRIATTNNINAQDLETCINTWITKQQVLKQKNLWITIWIRATPSTAIIDKRTWAYTIIRWWQPLSQFAQPIETLYRSLD